MRLSLPSLLAVAALLLAVLGSCGSRSAPPRLDGAVFPAGLHAPSFTLRDERGQAVSLPASAGTVQALVFLPPDQPTQTLVAQQVRGALDELGSRQAGVTVLLIGGMPAWRGARLLRETSLGDRAHYLTDGARLFALWKAYDIPGPGKGPRAYLASTSVILLDRAGFERVGFPVEQLTPEGLAHDIAALLAGV